MKNLIIINLFLFTSSRKKLIFVFILLLLLPFTGCKSVVKETVVEEPVRIVSPNGDVYVGEIVSGQPHGQGTYTFPDGRKYVGEFRNGKFHGQGTRAFPDGSKYVGELKDGEYHGQGTYTFHDGRKYVGEFREGRPWNITHYDKNGNIIVKFVNGVEKAPEALEERAVEVRVEQ